MTKDLDLILTPEEAFKADMLLKKAAYKAGVSEKSITDFRFLRRSIDARRRDVKINARVRLYIGEKGTEIFERVSFKEADGSKKAVIVGAGPAGLFAALTLLEHGVKPIILERGKDVHSRRIDTARLSREGILDPESNYAFGEGGAGAFSDGKLYTRSVKRGNVGRILSLFCQHGADESIISDTHPHIGTDVLPCVIENMRKTIIAYGGEVHFNAKVISLLKEGDETIGAVTEGGEEFRGPVILATGHSAKDVYRFLLDEGFELEGKDTAIGVRLEHPQHLIDQIQYHDRNGRGLYLPPASYSFVTQVNGRGVYSFCMCPGGVIVPSATEYRYQNVNGMSGSKRAGLYGNSAMVVQLRCDDVPGSGPLKMLSYIEEVEKKAFIDGFKAPSDRMLDFVEGRVSSSLPKTTYPCGVEPRSLDDILPQVVSYSLREGFKKFGAMTGGRFLTNDALMLGVETRTSSPVRIVRDEMMRQGKGFFPAGEGAGYAGGIVSAAIDGTEVAMHLLEEMNER